MVLAFYQCRIITAPGVRSHIRIGNRRHRELAVSVERCDPEPVELRSEAAHIAAVLPVCDHHIAEGTQIASPVLDLYADSLAGYYCGYVIRAFPDSLVDSIGGKLAAQELNHLLTRRLVDFVPILIGHPAHNASFFIGVITSTYALTLSITSS